jgi:quinoprotein glucose dehydrogenase
VPQHYQQRRLHFALTKCFHAFILALFVTAPALAWEHWGGDRGGMRFSPLAAITPDNVGNLVKAWQFRTGDLDARRLG